MRWPHVRCEVGMVLPSGQLSTHWFRPESGPRDNRVAIAIGRPILPSAAWTCVAAMGFPQVHLRPWRKKDWRLPLSVQAVPKGSREPTSFWFVDSSCIRPDFTPNGSV
jgi:hypothetical protein